MVTPAQLRAQALLEGPRGVSGGMLTTPVVTPSVVPSVAPTAPTGTVQGGGAINPIAVTKENNPEGQYLIIPASTRGEAKNPFIAPPEPYYGTEADLREMYDNTNELKDTFGSFDNYLNYSQEVQSNLENADWFIKEDDSWRPSSVEWGVLNGEDRGLSPNEREQAWSNINDRRKNAVKSNYQQWLMQEDTQGLLSKYGIQPIIRDDKGNVYTFTGNNYQMTVKAKELSFADYAKVGLVVALGFAAGPALSAALAPALGATGAAAVSSGIISSAQQLALTGEVDFTEALKSAASAGLATEAFNALQNSGVLEEIGNTIDELTGTEYQVVTPTGETLTIDQAVAQGLDPVAIQQGLVEGYGMNAITTTVDLPDWAFDAAETGVDVINTVLGTGQAGAGSGLGEGTAGGATVLPEIPQLPSQQQPTQQPQQQTDEQPQQQTEGEFVTPEELAGTQDPFVDTTQEDTTSIVDSLLDEYTSPIKNDIQRQQEAIDNLIDQVANSPVPPTAQEVASYLQENGVPLDQDTLTDIQNRINEATANQVTQEQVDEAISGAGFASSTEVDALGESLAADIAANGELTEANLEAINSLGTNLDDFIAKYATDVEGLNEAVAATDESVLSLAETTQAGFEAAQEEREALASALDAVGGDVTALDEATQQRFEDLGITVSDLATEFGDQFANLESSVAEDINALEETVTTGFGQAADARTALAESLSNKLEEQAQGFNTALTTAEANLLSEITGVESSVLEELSTQTGALEELIATQGTTFEKAQEDINNYLADFALETEQGFGQAAEEREVLQEGLLDLETALDLGLTGLEGEFETGLTELGSQIGSVEENLLSGLSDAELGRRQLASRINQREFKPAPIPKLSYQPLQLEGLIQGPQKDYVNELNQIINRSLFEGMI